MIYIIYVDGMQLEEFDSDESTALKKYEEQKEFYKGEDMYDKIKLFEVKKIKEESL